MSIKTAIVTGAASGMGRVAAERLAAAGARVALVDLNEGVLQEMSRDSTQCVPFPCDVSDPAAVADMVARVEAELGPVDRLVHAAALMPVGRIESVLAENFMRLMAVNFGGTVNVTKAVLPRMLARRVGEIIVFGSIVSVLPAEEMGAYSATKAAVASYFEVLANEHEGSGIRFLLVCPPGVNTPLLKQMGSRGPASVVNVMRAGKLMTPEAVLDATDAALKTSKLVVFPGAAQQAQLFRRYLPGLMKKIMPKGSAAIP